MKSLYDDLQRSYGQLRELEALRDHLVHLIVHDMRTPLQGILGYLQLLERGADEKQRRFLRQAQENGEILARLTEDLLTVHQMENGQLVLDCTPASVGDLCTEVCSALAGLAKMQEVDLVSEVPPGQVQVVADRGLLRRVLLNLVGNALKFTPAKGRVELSAREVGADVQAAGTSPEPGFEAPAAEPWILVTVRDTGPGIPREYHDKIFEKFAVVDTMQPGGRRSTGLGLTFCKLAVEAHGGRIGIQSDVSQGCTMWFMMPAGAA
jgi:signal transduction histidine kinase